MLHHFHHVLIQATNYEIYNILCLNRGVRHGLESRTPSFESQLESRISWNLLESRNL